MHIIHWMLVSVVTIRSFIALAATVPALSFIFYDRSYHVYYGLALIIISLLVQRFPRAIREAGLGIGLGLFFDDVSALLYLIFGAPVDPIGEYWSPLFILPLLMGILLVVLFQKYAKRI